jgi:hypothetical protein
MQTRVTRDVHHGLLARPVLATLMVAATVLLHAQTPVRTATSLPVMLRTPVFFQSRVVSFIATPQDIQGVWRLPIPAPQQCAIVWRDGAPPAGAVEIRGTFFDVGRFAADDSRLAGFGIPPVVKALNGDAWPARERLFVVVGATWTAVSSTTGPASARAVVLDPTRFEGQTVTIRGRFRGQNLFGDVPAWPRQSQWDFVLLNADAAIWITGLRPRGKDFDFDPTSRRSANRWLEATGIVRVDHGFPFLAARSIVTAEAVEESAPEVPADKPAPPPPPAIVFSAPADGEIDVSPSALVRIQFSRDMRADSFEKHITVKYGTGAADTPPPFTLTYRPGNLALELRFEPPLARLTTVTIDVETGVVTRDGAPFPPSRITFTTGGGRERSSPRTVTRPPDVPRSTPGRGR